MIATLIPRQSFALKIRLDFYDVRFCQITYLL
jgi:hypothetical protein